MRLVEGCADRAGCDLEHVGDPLVVEVGVVAKEQHKPLALWKGGDDGANAVTGKVAAARNESVGHLVQRQARGWQVTAGIPGGVDDRPPYPAFEAPSATVLEAAANRARECILHGLVCDLHVA